VPPLSARLARRFTSDDAELWARAAIAKAVALGRDAGVDVVVASGPPFSVLGAGLTVARELGVPFVVDMRDPWRDNPVNWYSDDRTREAAVERERRVMSGAAAVVAASDTMAQEARELGAHDVRTLPNGFDSADLIPWAPNREAPLTLAFMGKVYGGLTEPRPLLQAMRILADRRPDLDVRFDLVGDAGDSAAQVAALGLAEKVRLLGYLPHREAIGAIATADAGVILIADIPGAKATQTGKLFEYLGMGLPVFVVGPVDGEAALMVKRARGGWAAPSGDPERVAAVLEDLADRKQAGTLRIDADAAFVLRFERSRLAAELAGVLAEVSAR
jgi:glycosyltransferase involved in cell wall biosynthesis